MPPRTGPSPAQLMRVGVAPISRHGCIRMDWRRQRRRFIAVTLIVVGLGARLGSALSCVGDCKGEGKVDITDLILGVQPVTACEAFANPNGKVDVAQLPRWIASPTREGA